MTGTHTQDHTWVHMSKIITSKPRGLVKSEKVNLEQMEVENDMLNVFICLFHQFLPYILIKYTVKKV